ncbi:MAG: hypothetical protein WBN16_05595 [Lutimonas sp.]|jgi:hypothetical protein
MHELKQKKNFVTRVIRFSDSKLYYYVTRFGNANEIDIPFENLSGEKVSFKRAFHYLLWLGVLCLLISVAIFISTESLQNSGLWISVLLMSMSLFFLVLYYVTREEFWKISLINENYIYIHKHIPDATIVNEFISDLIKSRNKYLKENFAVIDENLSYEGQLDRLKWLKSIKAISKKEFEKKYDELKQTLNPEKGDIGFKYGDSIRNL